MTNGIRPRSGSARPPVTDDAEGEVVETAASALLAETAVPDSAVLAGLSALTGEIEQVPSAVSAIKVRGVRSYARVRAGESVELAARRVTIHSLETLAIRRTPWSIDVDIDVLCSSGTYIRAIARDLGVSLGIGGHLTALRRQSVGPFTLDEALTLDALALVEQPVTMSLAAAADRLLPRREVTDEEACGLSNGGTLPSLGMDGPYAVFGPDGEVVAIVEETAGKARSQAVLATARSKEV